MATDPEPRMEERTCPHCGLLYRERHSPDSNWWATCPRCRVKDSPDSTPADN
jgi:uncharacterized paraquat-inducible protein A